MLRQTEFGPAGAGIAALRLDPSNLPIRFEAADGGADDGQRTIDLLADRVVIRRTSAGARMKLQVLVSSYRGVAVRVGDGATEGSDRVEVVLIHADPSLNVPLFSAEDADDVVAEWQLWAKVFALPMMTVEMDGSLREAFPRMGAVLIGTPGPRRRRHSTVKARRPMALMRRKPGGDLSGREIHREREIIARS
ncbi:DUF6101 family protein [Phreatobacter aquaticus]|uniref:DUF6101 family protein n=1 Tax=Phreatobacter aquaticus TaxID=2570229 RepID=UPI00210FBD52|nr:DUF6101 family protein [Phreatobacter aquaticus]